MSLSLGNITDERIVEQLAGKYPVRKEDVPDSLDAFAPFRRLHVDVIGTLRHLDPKSGTSTSSYRNSYLRALTRAFSNARAASAVSLLNDFADKYINAEFSSWIYQAFTAVKLAAQNPTRRGLRGARRSPTRRLRVPSAEH